MSTPLNIPADVREAFVKQTTEYIEGYETHDARVWAESASEVAAALARAADQYATAVLAAELERIAGVEDGVITEMTERRDERKTVLDIAGVDPESDPIYAALSGVVHARSAVVRKIRERVAELRGESR